MVKSWGFLVLVFGCLLITPVRGVALQAPLAPLFEETERSDDEKTSPVPERVRALSQHVSHGAIDLDLFQSQVSELHSMLVSDGNTPGFEHTGMIFARALLTAIEKIWTPDHSGEVEISFSPILDLLDRVWWYDLREHSHNRYSKVELYRLKQRTFEVFRPRISSLPFEQRKLFYGILKAMRFDANAFSLECYRKEETPELREFLFDFVAYRTSERSPEELEELRREDQPFLADLREKVRKGPVNGDDDDQVRIHGYLKNVLALLEGESLPEFEFEFEIKRKENLQFFDMLLLGVHPQSSFDFGDVTKDEVPKLVKQLENDTEFVLLDDLNSTERTYYGDLKKVDRIHTSQVGQNRLVVSKAAVVFGGYFDRCLRNATIELVNNHFEFYPKSTSFDIHFPTQAIYYELDPDGPKTETISLATWMASFEDGKFNSYLEEDFLVLDFIEDVNEYFNLDRTRFTAYFDGEPGGFWGSGHRNVNLYFWSDVVSIEAALEEGSK